MGISLRWRILLLIGLLAAINVAGSVATVWFIYQTNQLNNQLIDQDLQSLMAAQRLESALVMQKGLLTYYFLTDSEDWLTQLDQHHRSFEIWLGRARNTNHIDSAEDILNEIESRYIRFVFDRDRVLSMYRAGQRKEGAMQHWGVRDQFFQIYRLTQKFKTVHEEAIEEVRSTLEASSRRMYYFAWGAIPFAISASVILVLIFYFQLIKPIRRLAFEADLKDLPLSLEDDIGMLRTRVHGLIQDVGSTQAQLAESKEHLMQSEKMATVGKLAAGVAHSVRNPLTSVKMRLFTLERSLKLNAEQKEDLDVISEEIRHIDTILRNFLEYARPPKLKLLPSRPSDIVDATLRLLKHRIESYATRIIVCRPKRMPELMLDADQIKEVFVNLIVNACEAMGEGGTIRIIEEVRQDERGGTVAAIRLEDDGPGIPANVIDKIFQPFFSSKEEGSGLGLSIVQRIIEEHRGVIQASSEEGHGAAFTLLLPIEEAPHGHHIDRG